jgi:predicted glycosyltransferase
VGVCKRRRQGRWGTALSLRVAFYSHNGFGLGHITRNAKLAHALLRRRPNADVLLITGSPGTHAVPLPNVDYVKLPSVRKQATGRWRPHSLDIEMEHLLRLRRTIILEAVRAYRPHLFVTDFLPLGVERELQPALEELARRRDAASVIGFRDILDEPQAVRATWEADGSLDALVELYDRVLVYGDPEWFDFASYGVPAELPHYVGLLGDANGVVRGRLSEETRVLASSGGGADGYPVLAAALEAVERLNEQRRKPINCTVYAGLLMAEPDYQRLRAIGKRMGGRVKRFVDDMPRAVARANAVVGMCGYNTVCDFLSFRRPALVVPRSGPSREQPIRASILAERGLAESVPLAEATAHDIAESLEYVLEEDDYPENELPDLDGIENTVDAVLELVE